MNTSLTDQTSEGTFRAGASFRVHGFRLDLDGITRSLRLTPTHIHKEGELSPQKHPYPSDMWFLDSPLRKIQPLDSHLRWLAEQLLPRRESILPLKKELKVDIYCWKTCYTEQANLGFSTQALRIFVELDVPLDVSLIFLPDEEGQEDGVSDAG